MTNVDFEKTSQRHQDAMIRNVFWQYIILPPELYILNKGLDFL